MNIEAKYKMVEKIIQSNDETLLNEVRILLGLSNEDFWLDLPAEVKTSIELSKEEHDRGEGIPHDEVLSEIKKQFSN